MAERLAIISRHVVLYQLELYRHARPVYAVVLVEGEVIASVVKADPDVPVEELMLRYSDWNPRNFEHRYVSPGMVDFNVRRNPDWEGIETLTKAAVSGGVTLLLEELTPVQCASERQGARYCDTGYTLTVDSALPHGPELSAAFGLKAYLAPPNDSVGGLFHLAQWLESAATLQLPVVLDAAVVDPKVLFIASPCRLVPLSERASAHNFAAERLFGGAFCDGSASSEEDDLLSPRAWQQEFEGCRKRRLSGAEIQQFRRSEGRLLTLGHIPDFTQHAFKDIHSALQEQIAEHAERLESLCRAEMMTYQGVGQTTFLQHCASEGAKEGLKVRKRPPALAVGNQRPRVPDEVYIQQLAHYPEDMESRGIKKLLKALKSVQCRVHIANVSTAKAVTLIQKAKDERLDITCETCPHFLYFADEMVQDGDTRLKNFPPIRNRANCNFLWELVKLNSIDAVCSQHVPVPTEFKFRPSFRKALPGVCGLGFTLPVLWTILKRPYTDVSSFEHFIVRVAKWTSKNPAKIMNIANRGAIDPGYLADLVVWDPFEEVEVTHSHSAQSAQCPYLQRKLYGRIHSVYVRGRLAFCDEEFSAVGVAVSRPNS